MTLREITQQIRDVQMLTETDSEKALKKNQDLFVDICRQDEVYIVPDAVISDESLRQKNFRPYIAPAQPGDPRLFLRIFSHEEVCTSFADKANNFQICKIDGVELMQLAKFYFLRGIYGFLLNDGLSWTVIAFPDFLTGCISSILGDERLVRLEYVQLIQFLNMVRQNDFYKICLARKAVKEASEEDKLLYVSPERQSRMEEEVYIFEELTLQSLLQAASFPDETQVDIRMDKFDLRVSLPMLTAAFRATGIDQDNPANFKSSLDFHVESIALDFCIEDFPSPESPITLHMQLTELPKPHDEVPDDEAQSRDGKVTRLLNILKSKRESSKKINGCKEKKPVTFPIWKGLLKPSNMPNLLRKTVIPIFVTGIAAILVIGIKAGLNPNVDKQFRAAVESNDYLKAASLYEEYSNSGKMDSENALQVMYSSIDKKLTAYANDTCTAEELKELLDCYAEVKDLSSKLNEVYDTASILETSKNAFRSGMSQTSIVERLSIWQGISSLDTGSESKIQRELSLRKEQYKTAVFLDVEGKSPKDAVAELILLQNFFPDDDSISKRILEVGKSSHKDTDPTSGSDYEQQAVPIIITDVACEAVDSTGRHDLRIAWTNQSGKTIEQITFIAAPYNSRGEQITTTKADEKGKTYSLYAAADMGPFEPGYETPENHYWQAVWYGPDIQTVKIHSVKIIYTDGTILDYPTEKEANRLISP